MTGFFISFEGPDGSGKSVQVQLLAEFLRKNKQNVICTKEPGGTPLGEQIRHMLLDDMSIGLTSQTELMLFLADRAHHVASVIQPALDQGDVVLCDRYVDSTMAYQSGGRGLEEVQLQQFNSFCTMGLLPHVTFLMDVDSEIGLARAKVRGAADRMELEALSFHQKLRRKYLDIADQNQDRIVVMDTSAQSIEVIHRKILNYLKSNYGEWMS